MSYEEEQQRKQRVMERFDKLMRRGVQVNKTFLAQGVRLQDQEAEADRLEKHIEVEESIQFQRKAYMAFCTGAEFLNKRYNPVGLYLNGWSESVMEDMLDVEGTKLSSVVRFVKQKAENWGIVGKMDTNYASNSFGDFMYFTPDAFEHCCKVSEKEKFGREH